MMDRTVARVLTIPKCDFCGVNGESKRPATVDGTTTTGQWAYMCEVHFRIHGVGLGEGLGQRLVLDLQ